MLSTVASTPLAPSSRMVAPTAIGVRSACRRSASESPAIRALNVVKLISTGPLLLCRERQADSAIADPSNLGSHHASFEQLKRQPFADVGDVREQDHRAGRR